MAGVDSFVDWLFKMIRTDVGLVVSKFIVMLWSMWNERNERVWNKVSRPPEVVVHFGLEALMD